MAPARPLLPAVLLLLTCAPQYESGKTACATSGQACPEGYVCVNIRCYKVAEAPDGSPAAEGTGGASGATDAHVSGTAGATDARVSGTGGSAGAGGGGGAGGAKDAGVAKDTGVAKDAGDAGASAVCRNPMAPYACPPRGGVAETTCWRDPVNCDSVTICAIGEGARACGPGYLLDCRYRYFNCIPADEQPGMHKCTDPAAPFACQGMGDIGPTCLPNPVDCSTRTVCPNEARAVVTACQPGNRVDCTRPSGMRCVPTTNTDGAAPDGKDGAPPA